MRCHNGTLGYCRSEFKYNNPPILSIQTPLLALLKTTRSKWYVKYSRTEELDQPRFSIARFVLD